MNRRRIDLLRQGDSLLLLRIDKGNPQCNPGSHRELNAAGLHRQNLRNRQMSEDRLEFLPDLQGKLRVDLVVQERIYLQYSLRQNQAFFSNAFF
ncbi:hypothetical protein D3C73_1151410 [compost metagenome]